MVASVALIGLTGFAIHEFYNSPYWNGVGLAPDQPVLFSHRHHAGELRIDCRNCHRTVETSAFAGMPSTQTCLSCHSQIFTDTAMLRPVLSGAAQNRPVAWTRVTHLPDHVYFNHSAHLAKGVACTTCHGDVGNMALMAKAEPMTMRWCLDCHRNPASRIGPRDALFLPHPRKSNLSNRADAPGQDQSLDLEHLTNCSTCHH